MYEVEDRQVTASAKREPGIPLSLKRLNEEVERQAELLNQLETRLEGVVRNEPQAPEKGVLEAPNDRAGLAGAIHGQRRMVIDNNKRIEKILYLLEL